MNEICYEFVINLSKRSGKEYSISDSGNDLKICTIIMVALHSFLCKGLFQSCEKGAQYTRNNSRITVTGK